jgi:hypothetical protein
MVAACRRGPLTSCRCRGRVRTAWRCCVQADKVRRLCCVQPEVASTGSGEAQLTCPARVR